MFYNLRFICILEACFYNHVLIIIASQMFLIHMIFVHVIFYNHGFMPYKLYVWLGCPSFNRNFDQIKNNLRNFCKGARVKRYTEVALRDVKGTGQRQRNIFVRDGTGTEIKKIIGTGLSRAFYIPAFKTRVQPTLGLTLRCEQPLFRRTP